MVIFAAPALSQTVYVNDRLTAYIRLGPTIEHRIIKTVRVGDAFEFVEKSKGWTKVRLKNGKEGWMLSRFVTVKEPSNAALKRITGEFERADALNKKLLSENKILKEENIEFGTGFDKFKTRANKLEKELNALKEESKEFFQVKKNLEEAQKELTNQKAIAEDAVSRLKSATTTRLIKWFLAGAGVLFFGLMVGILVRPKKRRSSLF